MNRTEHLGLAKPEGVESADIDLLNDNADILDREVAGRVKLVNGKQADENGNVAIEQVPFAENLVSEDAQQMSGEFIFRMTGGDASLSDGDARLIALYGRMRHDGYAEEQLDMTVTMATRSTGEEEIACSLDKEVFRSYVADSGTITLTYTNAWSTNPSLYGITVSGTPKSGDTIAVVYVKESRGTIVPARPTSFRSTGWNLYNGSVGYAHVKKYAETAQYMIEGLYTGLTFSTTVNGERTAVQTVNGLFTIDEDGYVFVAGGGSNTALFATWSDWTEGYPGEYEAYTESTVDVSSVMLSHFPYGLCSVAGINDEINLNGGKAVSKITRQDYNATNLEAAKQSGRSYVYDEDYIYIVKAVFDSYSIDVDGAFTACDHGTEIIDGTEVPVYVQSLYGQNLRDKLRTDVVTISAQILTNAQKNQVTENIGAARHHFISYDETASSSVSSLVNALIARMTENGTYAFSGSWNNWSYGYDAFCTRMQYRSDGVSYSGTVYARAGAAWSFSARSSDEGVTIVELVDEYHSTAGYHNAKYRGKNLGNAVTAEQWETIGAGKFNDMYVGDYWAINDISWYIAGFDYWFNQGDTNCTTHHVVIVPWNPLAQGPMNNTNTTDGGYVGSDYYTGANSNTLRATADSKIKAAFGASHLLTHREFLSNAITNGYPSAGAWYDSTFELMTEQMVYGSKIYASKSAGANLSNDVTLGYSQLPLFQHNKWMASNRSYSWLRDIATAAYFVGIGSFGVPGYYQATNQLYVRPAFGITA